MNIFLDEIPEGSTIEYEQVRDKLWKDEERYIYVYYYGSERVIVEGSWDSDKNKSLLKKLFIKKR